LAQHEEQLQWEKRAGRTTAYAAFASAILVFVGSLYPALAIKPRPDGADELLAAADHQPEQFLIGSIMQALGTALVAVVLVYLFKATRYRRKQMLQAALALAIAGPIAAAVVGIGIQIDRINIGHDFVAHRPPPPSTAKLAGITDANDYLDEVKKLGLEKRADQYLTDKTSPVLTGIGFASNLALGFATVIIALNAMRAGLLSRFMGILGIIIGALYVLPLLGGPQILQLFWLGALGVLFLGRWPGGAGPAWASGEEVPWPTAAQQREEVQKEKKQEQEAREQAQAPPPPEPSPRAQRRGQASKKKKRKRRG
jgi:putative Mn2+ efflux pump MntP